MNKLNTMTMTPRLSKLVFTSHITFSIGWFGAVAVFLALAITGITTHDNNLVRAVYLAMELSAWFIIVPFCIASLLTGLIQALGTKWGLFKQYWIVVKLILTVASTIVLLLHMKPISYLSGVATSGTLFLNSEESGLRVQLIADSGAALIVLLVIIAISVYKPWGKIQYSKNSKVVNLEIQNKITGTRTSKSWGSYILIAFVILLLVVIIKHLISGGMGHH